MARVTTEDCIDKEPNRFNLVMLASLRSRELSTGFPATVERDNDKHTVLALREIAEGTQLVEQLHERAVTDFQQQNSARLMDDEFMMKRLAVDSREKRGITSIADVPDESVSEDQLRRLMEGME